MTDSKTPNQYAGVDATFSRVPVIEVPTIAVNASA